jgi:hypothetical protein
MAKKLYGKAPLTIVRTGSGAAAYVYKGRPAPNGVPAEERARLLDEGYLEERDVAEEAAAPDGPPAKSATKADWVAYARTQGATDEDLDGKTRDDLVSAYGES